MLVSYLLCTFVLHFAPTPFKKGVNYERVILMQKINTSGRVNLNQETVELKYDVNLIEKGQEALFGKIDYFKCTFFGTTIDNILTFLGVPPDKFVTDLVRDNIMPKGYDLEYKVSFSKCNIQFVVPVKSFTDIPIDGSIFSTKYSRIYLTISGQGLDYIRLFFNQDIEEYIRCKENYIFYFPLGAYITRLDFAFDFVNWHKVVYYNNKPMDLLDLMKDYIFNHSTDSGRICCCGHTSSLKSDLRWSSGRTITIGGRTSAKCIRFYDKKAEFTSKKKKDLGLYIKSNPFCNPDSWIRIELEVHDQIAQDFCFSDLDYCAILQKIVSDYSFADLSTPRHRREPIQWWKDFFNWEHVSRVYVPKQKPYFVQVGTHLQKRIENIKSRPSSRVLDKIASWKAGFLVDGYDDKWLFNTQLGVSQGNYICINEWARFVDTLAQLDVCYDDLSNCPYFYFDDNNFLRIKTY